MLLVQSWSFFSAWYLYSNNFSGQKGQETCSKLSGKPISAAHREGYGRNNCQFHLFSLVPPRQLRPESEMRLAMVQ